MSIKLDTREYSLIAALAAISAIFELIHVGYQLPQFGMWIDVVAVTWLTAFFLFGFNAATLTSLIGAIIITLFAPSSWLGASMKWVCSLPMWTCLFLWLKINKKNLHYYDKFRNLIAPLIIGLIIRIIIALPLNYYYAIPIWTGLTAQAAITAIPWEIIVFLNLAQGIIDVCIAWMLVYHFKLIRFATNDN